MAEFSWAYIDSAAIVSASGPTGSIQYRVADSGGNTAVSGTQNFVYHNASSLLAITGSVEISGTLTANQYNVNVIDKTVTNISASGDTIFGDTADDTHQFTGSMFINGPLSASTSISASAFYGDGSTLTGISPAGSNTEVQFNNAGAFGASPRATIALSPSSAALAITGSVTVTGSASNTTTVIDGTHVSSSLNISGSNIYADNDAHANQFYGDISVSRYVTHDGDADTYLDFTDDKLTVKVGNREMLTLTEAGADTFVINNASAPINTTINSDNGDVLNASTAGIILNDSGMPGHDLRVESNLKQNAIYLDADLQYVHLLADDASPAGGVGSDMALFVSGTIGSKNSGIRGTAVFGGDMVVSGSLYVDGNTALGNAAADVVTVASQLTASQGALFNEQVVIVDDKNLVFGSGGDSVIKYDEASSDRLVVSGSSTGLWLGGGAVIIDTPLTQVTTTMHVTGAVHITGSDAHLLVLHAKDTDNTRELVFRKDVTTDAGSIYINSSEHMFFRSEVSNKDIIFRTNSENPIRCFGSNHFVGIGNKTSANAQLDVDGNAIVSGTLTTTDDINLLDDKKLNLGNSADALIEYDSGINKLAISGSAAGVELMGGGISLDYPGGTVQSGSAAYGSFLAMNASNQVVLSTPNDPAITLFNNGTHTITTENRTILLNTSSGVATCNLPAASTAVGLTLTFKKILGGNNVVIDGNSSETIDGATTTTLTAVNQSVTIQCNGVSWYILSNYVP